MADNLLHLNNLRVRKMMLKLIRSFFKRENGNIALIVTIAMLPMVTVAGASIDLVRAQLAKTSLQQAVDAAGLAGGANPAATEAEVLELAQDFLSANADGLVLDIESSSVTTELVGDVKKVNINATAKLETIFLKLANVDTLDVNIDSSIQRSESGGLHVALVLDTTASMNQLPSVGGSQTKIQSLRTAATALVNQLMDPSSPNVRIGVVPYVGYVRIRTAAEAKNPSIPIPAWIATRTRTSPCSGWIPPGNHCARNDCFVDGVWTINGCITPGQGPTCTFQCNNIPHTFTWDGCVGPRVFELDGQTITTAHLSSISSPTSPPYPGVPQNTWHCPHQRILELTNNKDSVTGRVNSLTIGASSANTYMPSGLTWGWNVLAPGEPYLNSESADLLAKGGRKALVLMTDGINAMTFRPQSAPLNDRGYLVDLPSPQLAANRTVPDALTSELCTRIKNDGIRIFTVAFDVNSPETEALLRNCASNPVDGYFDPNDGAELVEAFENIGNQLRNVRLTQ
jgi:Flp pilus assembly protein TadG